MLFSSHRRVFYVPLLYFGASGFFTALSLAAFQSESRDTSMSPLLSLSVGALFLCFAVASCRSISVSGAKLLARGFRKQRTLDLDACAFGVRLRPGRSPAYVVFVTDSVSSEDIGEWGNERGARAAISRLQAHLAARKPSVSGGAPQPNPRRKRAEREVAEVERQWKRSIAAAEKTVADYYQSRTWRITRNVLVGGVLLYALGASLYFFLTQR
jgi:hypothetical protein